MREFPFVCTACDADFPGAAELAEHLREQHEPQAREDLAELADRGGDVASVLEELRARLGRIDSSDIVAGVDVCVRLHKLRQAAAAAIAGGRRPVLVAVVSELEALASGAAAERDYRAAIAKVALESAQTVRQVLEVIAEPAQ